MAIAKPYRFPGKEDYQKGFRVMLSSFRQNGVFRSLPGEVGHYLHLPFVAYQEAKNNFDEALLLNTRGFRAEASRANIFLVKDTA